MGEVYRARDTKLDRDVAPDPQAIPMERLMTTLNPPISIFVVVAVAMLGSTVQAQSSGAGQMVSVKALFMTVWCPDSRSVESNCGIPRG